MFSLLTICIYITTFTSLSIIVISLSDSHLELIILAIPHQAEDIKLSISFIGCLPYGPIIIEYPYTIGPIPLIFAPFRVACSLTICFYILFSIYLRLGHNSKSHLYPQCHVSSQSQAYTLLILD